uniref:ascorbate ferrireductase (transmembrane) n=2 Tax=Stomoxys calcitrans TaxID=35570 RepID=A0A1I8NY41_STOCA
MSCNNFEVFDANPVVQPFMAGQYNLTNACDNLAALPMHNFSSLMAVGMNLFNHILIVTLTSYMVYKCWLMEFQKTALHAHLCTIGFVLLMAEGVMVRYRANILFSDYSAESKTLLHALLQFIGGFLGIIGTLQKYWGKEVHFKSRHAKFGLAACIFCFINFVAGFCVLILPSTRMTMKLLHTSLGLLTFVTGMLAQIFGYDTGFFHRNFTHKRLFKFVTFVILAISIIGPFKTMTYKMHLIFFGNTPLRGNI